MTWLWVFLVTALRSSKSRQSSIPKAMITMCHGKWCLWNLPIRTDLHSHTRSVIENRFSTLGKKDLLPEIQLPDQDPPLVFGAIVPHSKNVTLPALLFFFFLNPSLALSLGPLRMSGWLMETCDDS